MRFNRHVFAASALVIYLIAFVPAFRVLPDSIQISSLILMGCISWLYGKRIGLCFSVLVILLNMSLLFAITDLAGEIIQTYYPTGTLISITLALTAGHIHDSNARLQHTRSVLADQVTVATREVENMTRHLIEQDEKERIRIGQDIHDGVGQYLTGMMLHSETLTDSLKQIHHPEAPLAGLMTQRIRRSMDILRKLSRSQLPIQPEQTSLESAVEEMVDYFNEISSAEVSLRIKGKQWNVRNEHVRHLYRIAQEALHCAIYECRARQLNILIDAHVNCCRIRVEASELRSADHVPRCLDSHVLKYRAQAIGAQLSGGQLPATGFYFECVVLRKEDAA